MTELELMDILQEQGWTISKVESRDKEVFRAERHRNRKTHMRYIGTANTLKKRTREDVLKTLAREARPTWRREGTNRKSISAKETCLSTVQRRRSGEGMQDIDRAPSFKEQSKVYYKLQSSKEKWLWTHRSTRSHWSQ